MRFGLYSIVYVRSRVTHGTYWKYREPLRTPQLARYEGVRVSIPLGSQYFGTWILESIRFYDIGSVVTTSSRRDPGGEVNDVVCSRAFDLLWPSASLFFLMISLSP